MGQEEEEEEEEEEEVDKPIVDTSRCGQKGPRVATKDFLQHVLLHFFQLHLLYCTYIALASSWRVGLTT